MDGNSSLDGGDGSSMARVSVAARPYHATRWVDRRPLRHAWPTCSV